jgi:hypothetical protein
MPAAMTARAELLGDPLHRGELRSRDQPPRLAAEARLDLELARGVDAVVPSNLRDDASAEVGERQFYRRHTATDGFEQEEPLRVG